MQYLSYQLSILILTFGMACSVGDCQVAGQATGDAGLVQLRVLTYNIHHGRGVDGKLDLERIAKVIQSAAPDIVALQEVDQNVRRSGSVDQPALLAQLTGMQVVFGGNLSLQGGRYGNALLSNLPILTHLNHKLPRFNGGEQRGVLDAQIRLGRNSVRVLATHLDHRRDDSERLRSAEDINLIVARHSRWPPVRPTVLAGDINATRGSPVLRRLESLWAIAGSVEQPTIPVEEPKRQIDFVFSYPADDWTVVDTQVIDERVASDHRPLLATLKLTSAPEQEKSPEFDDILQALTPSGETILAADPNEWQSRRELVRQAMQSVMGYLPLFMRRPPPKYEVIDTVDCGTYTRQLIKYRSQPGCETPAYLCIPNGIPNDVIEARTTPAVLCLHPTDDRVGHDVVVGLGGKPNRQYASELAERGYITLAPSYPLLANYQPDLQQLGWESGTLKAIWDNIRGIDLLQSLIRVDPEKIGVIGHSLGGHNSIYTAVFDERIKAIVSSCGFDSYTDYYDADPTVWQPGKGWTQLRYMPRLANYRNRLNEIPFDFDEMLAAIAPRDVLVVAPLHDSNFRAASVDRMTARGS